MLDETIILNMESGRNNSSKRTHTNQDNTTHRGSTSLSMVAPGRSIFDQTKREMMNRTEIFNEVSDIDILNGDK